MPTFDIAEAQIRFTELVEKALAGEEVVIARDDKPLLKLVPLEAPKRRREPGSGKGQVLHMAADFDATPECFEDYMRSEQARRTEAGKRR